MDKLMGPEILKEKYSNPPLHTSLEVNSASRGIRSNDPLVRIQRYLDRLENIVGDKDNEQRKVMMGDVNRPRSLSLLREMVMDTYVRPQKGKLATGAAALEERAARELGINMQYGEQELQMRGDIAVKDLENSLDQWILYLSDKNEPYPTWFRYYTFRSVLGLGRFDKDKGEFPKRSAGTNLLFPDIDRGALGYMQDILEAAKDSKSLEGFREAQAKTGTPSDQMLTKEKAQAFSKLPFAKQYSESIEQRGEITPEMRAETNGKWVRYSKGSDATTLWKSLQNKGVPWCTAGLGTAQTQLEGGDFYVYYTLDKQGKSNIPRIAIRMQGETVFEARGVADNQQNLEANMANIAEEKLDTLPGAEKYRKASADMKLLTGIENKIKKGGQSLSHDELVFLYEIDSKIEGFGYEKDPRIEEIINSRNLRLDVEIMYQYLISNPEYSMPQSVADSKQIFDIEKKSQKGLPLIRSELIFLYQIDHKIKGLNNNALLIESIRNDILKNRSVTVDAPVVLGCLPVEIAWSRSEINRNTRAYIGPLYNGIFTSLPETVQIYTSFPEGQIKRESLTIGGENKDQLQRKLERANIQMSSYAKDMMKNKDFTTERQPKETGIVKLKVGDLGITNVDYPTTDQIYAKAKELGLDLVPAEVGPHLRLKYQDQPNGEWLYIGMKQIADSGGYPYVFGLRRGGGGLWLDGDWANPSSGWGSGSEFVFSFRK